VAALPLPRSSLSRAAGRPQRGMTSAMPHPAAQSTRRSTSCIWIRLSRLRAKGSCAPFLQVDFLSLYISLIDAAVALASTGAGWGRHHRVQAAALVHSGRILIPQI